MSNEMTANTARDWIELSLAQQSIWLDAKLSGTSTYQLGTWARIEGTLDEAAVRQSIKLLMARHDALRLRIDDELPRQWLDASAEVPLVVSDFPADQDADALFARHVESQFATPMPLGDRALFSVELIRVGEHLTFLLWRFHHLIVDSAAVNITLKHWLTIYDAMTSPASQELGPPSSYLATIASDASYLKSAAHQQDLAYWSSRFEPLPPPLIDDMGLLRPSESAIEPTADCSLTGERFEKLAAAAKSAGTTANRALFALFAVVLGQRFDKTDVVSGVALHRRELANLHTIGLMAGVIPVRCQFEGHWSIEECVQAFSEQVDADLRHQRLPVDILSRSLGLSGTGRAGLFEAAMSYLPADPRPADDLLAGTRAIIHAVKTKEASPITLHAAERAKGQGLSVHVAVNTDFLDAAEATALADLLGIVVDQFCDSPEVCFDETASITPAERTLLIDTHNATAAAFPLGTLDGLFDTQASLTPDAPAVVGIDGSTLTYRQLAAEADALAMALRRKGVTPGDVVGVRFPRSADTVVAILAILKAHAVYLPLDPAYPDERLDYIAQDAGAKLVLRDLGSLRADVGDASGLPSLPASADASRLAYVIYTSGTTGRPKGVAVPHSAAVNLAFARRAAHDPLGTGDRVLAAISVGFDVSIGQLLLPLLSGATVVVADDLRTLAAGEFWKFLDDRRVTHINSVPSFFDSVLDALPSGHTLVLKRLMLGGEPLAGPLVARIKRALPTLEVVNMYGPTEACIDATARVVTERDFGLAVVPIGRPLPNYRLYVLDPRMSPVGVGVRGEIYLGGAGLARGYVNAPELTAERFVEDPFNPGQRLYKTGDLGRWNPGGDVEFLGRNDQQVKVRGFRVETGEIEAALRRLSGVREAAVVARPHAGDTRLLAYCVGEDGNGSVPTPAGLREALGRSLPDYMIPAAFVTLDALPLTPNGKLDRKRLPDPEQTAFAARPYEPPANDTERQLADIWQTVLDLPQVGRHDNFFQIGGHSLAVLRLVNAINSELGVSLSMRSLFQEPTICELAMRINGGAAASTGSRLVPLRTGGDGPALFCIHPAGGHVFSYLPLVRQLGDGFPVYGLAASGLEDGEALAESVEAMAAEYVIAIRAVQPTGPYHFIGLSSGGLIAYEITRQLTADGAEVPVLMLMDTTVPGSTAETIFSDDLMLRAMAGEFGCDDLLSDSVTTLGELVSRAHSTGRLPPDFDLPQAERIAAVFRNTVGLHMKYRVENYAGSMVVLRARKRFRKGDLMPDWSPHVTGELNVIDFDCGHADFVSASLAPVVARLITRYRQPRARPADAASVSQELTVAGIADDGVRS